MPSVREKVNGFLALEIMCFAILLAMAFYVLNRRATLRMAIFQRESAELRALNARLQREIAERQRVQENLAVAEQTLAQSSKLAALGEMSAAVSHELNQPAGGDEDLPCRRAAAVGPQPPRRGGIGLSNASTT